MSGSRFVASTHLNIATFNTHKGLSSFSLRHTLHEQRQLIRKLQADVLFLQEICGTHTRHHGFPHKGQYHFLAEDGWEHAVYGQNATRISSHHGNAIFSKYPIVRWENENISESRVEQRGLLHAEIAVPGWDANLHCICVHLGLMGRWRIRQLMALIARVERMVPKGAPVIIAGDFNDWRQKAGLILRQHGLHEVFEQAHGAHARSFPSVMPIFRLDRIYTRGFEVQGCQVHHGLANANMSDHVALSASLIGNSNGGR